MPNVNSLIRFFAMVLLVMIGIYAVKWASRKWNIPLISKVAEEV